MKYTLLVIGIFTSCTVFSQNTSEIVDVYDEKIKDKQNTEAQTYIAEYLTNFFSKKHERINGFYLVVEQRRQNNRNTLEMENIPFLTSKDIKDIVLIKNGDKYPTVSFQFNNIGTSKLQKVTSQNIGNGISIIIDKTIITMPMIFSEIQDGKIEYHSNLPYNETEILIKKLR
jgi:Preprotein translocase subunit SecD